MELSRGQQEYLLELLSAEYVIPQKYRDSLKAAIKRYATVNYTDEELDFLLDTPQSLAAVLLLNTTDSLETFARYFALWANCVEYNALDANSLMEATLINPDPSSQQKLLQIIDTGEQYQVIPAAELRYMSKPRPQERLSTEPNPTRRLMPSPMASALSFRSLEGLMEEFLSFADQKAIAPSATRQLDSEDYVAYLEKELARTQSTQYTWSQLRERAMQLPLISSTYQWIDRLQGLIVPSNIAFINHLNALPIKSHRPTTVRPAQSSSPFQKVDQLMAQFSPKRLMQNLRTLRPPRLPAFPFPGQHQHSYPPNNGYNHAAHHMNAPTYAAPNDDLTIASTALPNTPHSEPATFTTNSKMPPSKKGHRIPPAPPMPAMPPIPKHGNMPHLQPKPYKAPHNQ